MDSSSPFPKGPTFQPWDGQYGILLWLTCFSCCREEFHFLFSPFSIHSKLFSSSPLSSSRGYYHYWSLLYSANLCCRAESLRSSRKWFWMSDCNLFIAHFEYPPKWCTYSSVWLLHGWCHVKLLLFRRTFCVHHATMHQSIITLYSKPHTGRKTPNYLLTRSHTRSVHVCLAVICQLHFR